MTEGYLRHRAEIIDMLDERFFPYWWVEQQISNGSIAVLENDEAVIGVERRTYPGGAVELHGMFAAGDMEAIGELVDDACTAAKAAGCDVAAIESRPGWAKLFKAKGFETDRVRIVKELQPVPICYTGIGSEHRWRGARP